jgi:two-component system, OmpR family, KDP operon response regulator KdpE
MTTTSTRKIRILCVEDDPQMRTFLMNQLRFRGHQVQAVQDGAQAINQAASFQPELILLDLSLPTLDGLAFLRRLREWSQAYVIVLSAYDEESVKIKALDLGADDYLTKPFNMEELLAHIRAAMRRSDELERLRAGISGEASRPLYTCGGAEGLTVDFANRKVYTGGQEVHLTPTEYLLLSELAHNPGKVLTHRELLRRVWGAEYAAENTYLRTFVRLLRRKLEPDPTKPRFLLNEPGVGYYVPLPDEVEA